MMEPKSLKKSIAFPEDGYINVTEQNTKKLSQLILGLPTTNILGTTDKNIREVVYDSRKSGAGSLFVAVPGKNWDGGVFIKDDIAKGASAFITQNAHDSLTQLDLKSSNSTDKCMKDSRKALSIVSANFYCHPSERISLTGITGTNGKTTTSYILEALFKAKGVRTGIIGTINYHYGNTKVPAPVTTPESLDLNRILDEMIRV